MQPASWRSPPQIPAPEYQPSGSEQLGTTSAPVYEKVVSISDDDDESGELGGPRAAPSVNPIESVSDEEVDHESRPPPKTLLVAKPAGDDKKREQLRMAFAKFDTDGSGSLDEEELANVLCMGSKLSQTEALAKAASIIRKYDFDGNGTLDVSFLGHATFTSMPMCTVLSLF